MKTFKRFFLRVICNHCGIHEGNARLIWAPNEQFMAECMVCGDVEIVSLGEEKVFFDPRLLQKPIKKEDIN